MSLLDSTVRSAERLSECELCCLGHRKKISALCFVYNIWHSVDYPMNDYLNQFIAVRNTRASADLGKFASVFSRCIPDHFSLSFLPAAESPWNLLPWVVFSGNSFCSFKNCINCA